MSPEPVPAADTGRPLHPSKEWQERAGWLFQNIPPWEDEYDQQPVVCVAHKRFIPCRPCMYEEVASVPYSSNPLDVNLVSVWQHRRKGELNDGDDRGR